MANLTTQVADILRQPEIFADVVSGVFTEKVNLEGTLMSRIPNGVIPSTNGDFVFIPHYNTISGDMTPITSSSSVETDKITQYGDRGVWVQREYAWATDDLVKMVTGEDPMQEIASQIGTFYALAVQKTALSVVNGVFASALASTHKLDSGGNAIDINYILDAKQKLGDSSSVLDRMMVHSAVHNRLAKDRILNWEQNAGASTSTNTGTLPSVAGLTLTQNDLLTNAGGVYLSLIGKAGSVGFATREYLSGGALSDARIIRTNDLTVELNRDAISAGGRDALIIRGSYLVHVNGVKWDSSTSNPTDAMLATGSNWVKVAPDKTIHIVGLETTI